MAIVVTGILLDPVGRVSAGTEIRVTAKSNEGATLKSLEGLVITEQDGSYNFNLVNGVHLIEINFSKEYHLVGEVLVAATVPSPITLPALLSR